MATKTATTKAVTEPTNGGEAAIQASLPYVVEVDLLGTSDLLFHRYNVEEVEAKANAAKNSVAKKTDNVEAYLYRSDNGIISLPGEYVRGAMCGPNGAAKYRQDPRSPRKSALDLYKAGVIALTNMGEITLASGEVAKDPDYLDKRRVVVQRNAISRVRPAIGSGWKATLAFQIQTPEYISFDAFTETLGVAGRLVGVGDFRPTFGRFVLTRAEVIGD